MKSETTLVDVLRDAASDASSILAASTSRPEPRPALSLAYPDAAENVKEPRIFWNSLL